jgi:DNA polymerase III alpha subunit
MINDKKTGKLIAVIEYDDGLDVMGLPKLDILGLSTLDKLMGVNQLLKTGSVSLTINEDDIEQEEDE